MRTVPLRAFAPSRETPSPARLVSLLGGAAVCLWTLARVLIGALDLRAEQRRLNLD